MGVELGLIDKVGAPLGILLGTVLTVGDAVGIALGFDEIVGELVGILLGWLLTVGLKVGLELGGVLDIVGAAEEAIFAAAVFVSVVFGKTLGSNDIVGNCVGLLLNKTEGLGRSVFIIFWLVGNLVVGLDSNVGELLLIGFIDKSEIFSDD